MDDKCHKEKKLGHIGKLEQRFPRAHVAMTVAGSLVGAGGLASVAAFAPGMESALSAMPFVLAPGGICAAHRFLNKEAGEDAICFHINDMRWDCCRKGEKTQGCTVLCDHCDKVWGNGPPCVLIKHPDPNAAEAMDKYEVFKRKHALVDMPLVDAAPVEEVQVASEVLA